MIHTTTIKRFHVSLDMGSSIVVNIAPLGKHIKRLTQLPEAWYRYCAYAALKN